MELWSWMKKTVWAKKVLRSIWIGSKLRPERQTHEAKSFIRQMQHALISELLLLWSIQWIFWRSFRRWIGWGQHWYFEPRTWCCLSRQETCCAWSKESWAGFACVEVLGDFIFYHSFFNIGALCYLSINHILKLLFPLISQLRGIINSFNINILLFSSNGICVISNLSSLVS